MPKKDTNSDKLNIASFTAETGPAVALSKGGRFSAWFSYAFWGWPRIFFSHRRLGTAHHVRRTQSVYVVRSRASVTYVLLRTESSVLYNKADRSRVLRLERHGYAKASHTRR